jgi:hypothetical protein
MGPIFEPDPLCHCSLVPESLSASWPYLSLVKKPLLV